MTIAISLIAGLVALYFGAEWLVRGGASLALRLGLTPLMVGLTVVAYGTSAPELIVSTVAAARGEGAIAVGNVIGSNILNIGFILGLTALVSPLRVQFQLVKFDVPVMIAVSLLFAVLFRDARIDRGEALLFLGVILAYTVLTLVMARRQASETVRAGFAGSLPRQTAAGWKDALLVLGGLGVLVLGSRFFVSGAVELARSLRISEGVIGLTVVAAGTSLPELAASIVAALRKQADIAIGNIVGSNIYNILAILGVSGLVAGPLDAPGISAVDVWVMVAISVALLPVVWTGLVIKRWEGAVLLAAYGGYLAYLWPK